MSDFMEVDSVSGTISGEDGSGLGPTFNGNSCAQCHAFPVVGGSSPARNPQVELANLDQAKNTVPSFITSEGPVREVRFVRNPDGSPDGGVHGLFTIRGRTDAIGCDLRQPNFAQQLAAGNVIFRIPTPTFGLGLVEATPDSTLQANLAANQQIKSQLGIGGALNTSGNDGTVTRFGWKAQNKSLMVFAGEAYNVEQGVSNEAFGNERAAAAGCVFNGSPEDATKSDGNTAGTAAEMSSDLVNFAAFMRFSAPPAPAAMSASAKNGASLFNGVGCGLCHTATSTGKSKFTGMSHVRCDLSPIFRLRPCTTWARVCRMASVRGRPVRTSSARLRSGVSASASSSCMMDGPPTYCRRFRSMLRIAAAAAPVLEATPAKAVDRKPTSSSADSIRSTVHRCRMC
jgi:Di-haem oxidoreductase, putative peroxidase